MKDATSRLEALEGLRRRHSGVAGSRLGRLEGGRPVSRGGVDLELSPDDLRKIEDMQLEAQGARYAEAQQRTNDR